MSKPVRVRVTDSNKQVYLYTGTLSDWRGENPHFEPVTYHSGVFVLNCDQIVSVEVLYPGHLDNS
jgi:hypothetical protein